MASHEPRERRTTHGFPQPAWRRAAEALGAAGSGVATEREASLGLRTTYRVGGAARVLVVAASVEQLQHVGQVVASTGVAVLVVGRGSNLLVADAGFDGLVVVLGEPFSRIDVDSAERFTAGPSDPGPSDGAERIGEHVLVRVGAAAPLPLVARRSVALGLTGFEWAVGVPGSLGGAVRMNAGGHGADMSSCLVDAGLVDLDLDRGGEMRRVAALDLALGYRRSAVRDGEVVVDATLRLARGDRARSEKALSDVVAWRRTHQPGGQNAGSVFANPEGDSAGRWIESAGAKGLRRGTAQVSTKHANFIQTDPGGSADDVFALMGEIRRRVVASGGPLLVPETVLVGFAGALGGGSGP